MDNPTVVISINRNLQTETAALHLISKLNKCVNCLDSCSKNNNQNQEINSDFLDNPSILSKLNKKYPQLKIIWLAFNESGNGQWCQDCAQDFESIIQLQKQIDLLQNEIDGLFNKIIKKRQEFSIISEDYKNINKQDKIQNILIKKKETIKNESVDDVKIKIEVEDDEVLFNNEEEMELLDFNNEQDNFNFSYLSPTTEDEQNFMTPLSPAVIDNIEEGDAECVTFSNYSDSEAERIIKDERQRTRRFIKRRKKNKAVIAAARKSRKYHLDTSNVDPNNPTCQYCNIEPKKKYAAIRNLREHILRTHMKAFRHQCIICPRKFFTLAQFRKHQTKHEYTIKEKGDLDRIKNKAVIAAARKIPKNDLDTSNIDPNNPLCPHCPEPKKKYAAIKNLREHILRTHMKAFRHQCSICERKFFTLMEFRKHQKKQNHPNDNEVSVLTIKKEKINNIKIKNKVMNVSTSTPSSDQELVGLKDNNSPSSIDKEEEKDFNLDSNDADFIPSSPDEQDNEDDKDAEGDKGDDASSNYSENLDNDDSDDSYNGRKRSKRNKKPGTTKRAKRVKYDLDTSNIDPNNPLCPHCPEPKKKYAAIHNLREHILRTHLKVFRHKCEICPNLQFFSLQQLRSHSRKHNKTNDDDDIKEQVPKKTYSYPCVKCGIKLSSKKYRVAHEMHQCKIEYNANQLTEMGITFLKCDWENCESVFVSKNLLDRHIFMHSGVRTHKCECGKLFSRKDYLTRHKIANCRKKVEQQDGEEVDANPRPRTKTTKEKFKKCLLCPRRFAVQESLDKHMERHPPIKSERICCELCGKFMNDYQLKIHLKQVHERKLNYFCTYENCNKGFYRREGRDAHVIAIHEPEKKVAKEKNCVCETCGKVFAPGGALYDHRRRVHLNQTKFECKFCKKKFYHRNDCKKHERSHERSGGGDSIVNNNSNDHFVDSLPLH